MLFPTYLAVFVSLQPALCSSLIDFSAARGDNLSMLGIRNLEAARGETASANTDDLYIEMGKDPSGTAALHYHRIVGDIRAEYHSLSGKIEADQTYYIGYQFSLAEIEQSLMIFQFKEFSANTASAGGANIPLSLEIQSGKLNFQYQSSYRTGRKPQWSVSPKPNTIYSIGLVINTATPGWVQLYWDGELQTFATSGTTTLKATTFPVRAEPKFGAYRGEVVGIDSYVYRIQIGTALSDIVEAAGLRSTTVTTAKATSTTKTTAATTTAPSASTSAAVKTSPASTLTTVKSSPKSTSTTAKASTTTSAAAAATSTSACGWTGHCLGDSCSVNNDCYSILACNSGTCGFSCSWAGHCQGDSCSTDNDCNSQLVCNDGICGQVCLWASHCEGASCSNDNDCDDTLVCDNGTCSTI